MWLDYFSVGAKCKTERPSPMSDRDEGEARMVRSEPITPLPQVLIAICTPKAAFGVRQSPVALAQSGGGPPHSKESHMVYGRRGRAADAVRVPGSDPVFGFRLS